MISRKDAVRLINTQMYGNRQNRFHSHYGILDLRELLDFIYGELPLTIDEELK